ncbi:MAG: SAM-dependent methyltransferase, partial [Brachymonas sp.]|nr:SAM-dependent methyltransferase [Brachymonas sp.]
KRAHLTRRMGFGSLYLPEAGDFWATGGCAIGYGFWAFEVESSNFGLWHPAVRSQAWLSRTEWMNRLGTRYWPIFGAAYCVVAIKRVRGMRMISPNWKRLPQRATAGVPVVPRSAQSSRSIDR